MKQIKLSCSCGAKIVITGHTAGDVVDAIEEVRWHDTPPALPDVCPECWAKFKKETH